MSLPVFVSVIGLLLFLCAFFYLRHYIKKRTSTETALEGIREEVNRLLIRIDETTNRDISLLEDKELSLKALLEETEKRLKVYTRELDRSLASERTYRELGKNLAVTETTAPREEIPVEEQAAQEENREEIPDNTVSSSGEQIRRLANSGFSPALIASRLGISISEVELAIALLERKPQL
ncbi:MAG: hypothetical protein LBH43_02600 [Treponema sp.]|jgi:hypothetical protein|nr:hypothetical protein [Treponema sp.]